MLNCLLDYVGVADCEGTAPESGVYLNELAGVSTRGLDALADDDKRTFLGVWRAIQARAARKMYAELARLYADSPLMDGGRAGSDAENAQIGAGIPLGLRLAQANAPYCAWRVRSVTLRVTNPINFDLNVWDAETGALLDTFPVQAVAGKNIVSIEKTYLSTAIFIGYASIFTQTPALTPYNACNCGEECGKISASNVLGIAPALGETAFSAGLCVEYSRYCAIEKYVCSRKDEFLTLWIAYLTIEWLEERLYSTRLNRFTSLAKEEATERLRAAQTEARELTAAVRLFDDDSCCKPCPEGLKAVYAKI